MLQFLLCLVFSYNIQLILVITQKYLVTDVIQSQVIEQKSEIAQEQEMVCLAQSILDFRGFNFDT